VIPMATKRCSAPAVLSGGPRRFRRLAAAGTEFPGSGENQGQRRLPRDTCIVRIAVVGPSDLADGRLYLTTFAARTLLDR
jgi:hypothetical protein